jgi:hypothetical protein
MGLVRTWSGSDGVVGLGKSKLFSNWKRVYSIHRADTPSLPLRVLISEGSFLLC